MIGDKKHKSLVFPSRMYLFVLPALVMFTIFWIFPLIQLMFYSVTDFNGVNYHFNYVGLKNYKAIIESGALVNSISNTMVYAFLIICGTNILGLLLALALNTKIKGKTFFRTVAYIPALFSAIVVGFIWSYVYMPEMGIIASIMDKIGLDGSSFNALGSFRYALYAIAVVEIWKSFGTTMIIYLAGLQTIDNSLIEAGRIDGCTEWQLIRKVKIPLITPTITINVVLSVIAGLKAFDYAFIMTNGGPGKSTNTLMFTIYKMAFTEQMMGKASAFAVVTFVVIIAITIVMLMFMNKREVEI